MTEPISRPLVSDATEVRGMSLHDEIARQMLTEAPNLLHQEILADQEWDRRMWAIPPLPSDVQFIRQIQREINDKLQEREDKPRNLRVTIIRNADGVAATSKPGDWLAFPFRRYWWEEGNAACDCNRDDWFRDYRDEERIEDAPCGHDRYRVKVEDADTGEVLYEEPAP